jgi:transcription elongation factor Elf1
MILAGRTCPACKEHKCRAAFQRANNRVGGLQVYCRKCANSRRNEWNAVARGFDSREEWRQHRDEVRKQNKIQALKRNSARNKQINWLMRLEMIAGYGGKCQCPGCQETTPEFLTLDHINNDGKAERAISGFKTNYSLFIRLKAAGWPQDRYQLLCMNCNWGRARHGGVCPHVAERRSYAYKPIVHRRVDFRGVEGPVTSGSEPTRTLYLVKGVQNETAAQSA